MRRFCLFNASKMLCEQRSKPTEMPSSNMMVLPWVQPPILINQQLVPGDSSKVWPASHITNNHTASNAGMIQDILAGVLNILNLLGFAKKKKRWTTMNTWCFDPALLQQKFWMVETQRKQWDVYHLSTGHSDFFHNSKFAVGFMVDLQSPNMMILMGNRCPKIDGEWMGLPIFGDIVIGFDPSDLPLNELEYHDMSYALLLFESHYNDPINSWNRYIPIWQTP